MTRKDYFVTRLHTRPSIYLTQQLTQLYCFRNVACDTIAPTLMKRTKDADVTVDTKKNNSNWLRANHVKKQKTILIGCEPAT